MLNYLWTGMLVIGVVYGALNGKIEDITNVALESSKEAVNLCIGMVGVMSFWLGLMEVAAKAGIIRKATSMLSPIIHYLFPNIPEGHKANDYIASNFIANILGLGWAATPAGLQAMEALEELEEDRRNGTVPGIAREQGVASNEMCTFLVLNISSLQLIPINIIAYRSQYGSVNPAAIVGAGLLATCISTLTGCLFCRIKENSYFSKESHTLKRTRKSKCRGKDERVRSIRTI